MKLSVVILGAGESGLGAAMLAKSKGFDVFLSDYGKIAATFRELLIANEIAFEEGGHTIEKLTAAHLVVKSPGIPNTVPGIQALKKKGIPVISEIEFASRYTEAKIIAITGTNGKTTTTLLTYHLLREAGFNVGVGGNIGNSFAAMVVDDVYDYYVLEISSFQLDDIDTFKPQLSMILNVTPDHLDRYEGSMDRYCDAKFRIAMNQSEEETLIAGVDSPMIKERVESAAAMVNIFPFSIEPIAQSGAWTDGPDLKFRLQDGQELTISSSSLPLYGRHNQLNALAAISAALMTGAKGEQVVEALKTFRNAPHRMELVAEIDGVKYINDSKATNVDAVYYALDGIEESIVWIAGGVDKGNDYEQIALLVEQKVSHLVGMGTDNRALTDFFSNHLTAITDCDSMQSAVAAAAEVAAKGMVVLLSPACASFDLFTNYMDRGDQFRAEVLELAKRKEKMS